MIQMILGCATGLLLGAALVWSGLHQPQKIKSVWALQAGIALKTVLAALGFGIVLTAFLSWLAVLDVDVPEVRTLSGGVLLGSVLAGAGIALCGRTALSTLAGLGGGQFTESLCTLAGLTAGAFLLPLLTDVIALTESLPPQLEGTLFRVTLDKPFLWQGGFLGQGCLGAVVLVLALWIPIPRAKNASEAAVAGSPQTSPEAPEEASESPPDDSPDASVISELLPENDPDPVLSDDEPMPPEDLPEIYDEESIEAMPEDENEIENEAENEPPSDD